MCVYIISPLFSRSQARWRLLWRDSMAPPLARLPNPQTPIPIHRSLANLSSSRIRRFPFLHLAPFPPPSSFPSPATEPGSSVSRSQLSSRRRFLLSLTFFFEACSRGLNRSSAQSSSPPSANSRSPLGSFGGRGQLGHVSKAQGENTAEITIYHSGRSSC